MTPEQALAISEAFDAIPDEDKHRVVMCLIARLSNLGAQAFFRHAVERIEPPQPEWADYCAEGVQ